MSKRQERQRFIRHYKEQTGETELDMNKVAALAQKMGWKMPVPPSPLDLLAKQFAKSAAEETEYDEDNGNPYRVYHAIPAGTGQLNLFYYIDIADATRGQMHKAAVIRREQMVRDGLQLSFDLERWNKINPAEEPIELPMDLTLDIEIAKHADEDDRKKRPA